VHDSALAHEADVKVPLKIMNRHGLIAGATGTGKTRTLQLYAAGVSVLLADVKGDVSRIADPGDPAGPTGKRAADLGIPFTPTAFPAEYLSLGGIGAGVPVRATVSDAARRRQDLSEIGVLRSRATAHATRNWRGGRHDPLEQRRPDTCRPHAPSPTIVAYGPDRRRAQGRQSLAAVRQVRARTDYQSAREMLAARVAVPAAPIAPCSASPTPASEEHHKAAASAVAGGTAVLATMLNSRSGRQVEREVIRGVFGILKKSFK
jgi:Bacterial protein of unknown function (DUF853)